MNEAEQERGSDEEGGVDDVVGRRQAISVSPLKLVLWLFSVRSLSRDTRGIWLWKASTLSRRDIQSVQTQ